MRFITDFHHWYREKILDRRQWHSTRRDVHLDIFTTFIRVYKLDTRGSK